MLNKAGLKKVYRSNDDIGADGYLMPCKADLFVSE